MHPMQHQATLTSNDGLRGCGTTRTGKGRGRSRNLKRPCGIHRAGRINNALKLYRQVLAVRTRPRLDISIQELCDPEQIEDAIGYYERGLTGGGTQPAVRTTSATRSRERAESTKFLSGTPLLFSPILRSQEQPGQYADGERPFRRCGGPGGGHGPAAGPRRSTAIISGTSFAIKVFSMRRCGTSTMRLRSTRRMPRHARSAEMQSVPPGTKT